MITVQPLEKPSKNRLLVCWREPPLCNYTEQLWALRTAAISTVCALSGKPIRRGDRVYRPVGEPLNGTQHLLADAVQELLPSDCAID